MDELLIYHPSSSPSSSQCLSAVCFSLFGARSHCSARRSAMAMAVQHWSTAAEAIKFVKASPDAFYSQIFRSKVRYSQRPGAVTDRGPTLSLMADHREAVSALALKEKNPAQKVLRFVKYQGLGNDFLLVDNRDSTEPKISPEQAVKLCDRNFGVGGDGVIFALPGGDSGDYAMRIFNADGSEPEMCGNGIRCMARFVAELENTTESRSYTINTLAGPIIPQLCEDDQVAVDMGPPTLNARDVPTKLAPNSDTGAVVKAPLEVAGKMWSVTCVSMGNPHCVTFGEQGSEGLEVNELPLAQIGPLFEHHNMFPARTNTEFVQILSPKHLRMRVWERGAGATLACGTGACAVVVAAILEGRAERKCVVDLPGGPLDIEWRESNNHVYMTGPAQVVFSGSVYL